MLIGLDFDNTIAGYDRVFPAVARREGLLRDGSATTKRAVRDALRRQPEGEARWMRLQGRVYGAHMGEADLIDGVDAFLARCRANGVPVRIVSHKTEFGHGDPDRINLREAARCWMDANGFFDAGTYGLSPDDVFFESTRLEKVARIAELGCTHFVDDLEEVFVEPTFPETTERYLLAAGVERLPTGPYRAFRSWHDISDDIFGGH